MTIKEKDGANDRASELDRKDVFRVNFGTDKAKFLELFETIPRRPSKGGMIEWAYDFTALDVLMPHPVYGWACWLCILNPKRKTLEDLKPLFDQYYRTTEKRFTKRINKK